MNAWLGMQRGHGCTALGPGLGSSRGSCGIVGCDPESASRAARAALTCAAAAPAARRRTAGPTDRGVWEWRVEGYSGTLHSGWKVRTSGEWTGVHAALPPRLLRGQAFTPHTGPLTVSAPDIVTITRLFCTEQLLVACSCIPLFPCFTQAHAGMQHEWQKTKCSAFRALAAAGSGLPHHGIAPPRDGTTPQLAEARCPRPSPRIGTRPAGTALQRVLA